MESVSHVWSGRAGEHQVLLDVSVEAVRGEVLTIAGKSGAGKTTLLGILGGLIRPTTGSLFMGTSFLWGIPEPARTVLRRNAVSFVFQRAEIVPSLSVTQNIALPALIKGEDRNDVAGRVADVLDELGLSHRSGSRACELSGGEARRVALARAVVARTPFVLADEPTGDLDPDSAVLVMRLLERLIGAGCGIVIVTHDPELAAMGARRLVLDEGRLVDE